MTKTRKAIPLRSIDGAMLTEGAEMMTLKVTTEGGGGYLLALPTTQLPGLIMTAAAMAGETARIKGDKSIGALTVESWRLGLGDDGGLILTLQLQGGAKIAYLLPKDSLDQLDANLDFLKDQAKASAGETVN